MNATLVAVVVIALFFDFTNGFHDTANSIATSVSTRALSPRVAVLSSAILNFIGAFFFFEVAATVATGIVNPEAITLDVVLAGLVGAITWNLITWYLGLPSSSSHALIGGIIGSSVAATGGFAVVEWEGLKEKVLIPSLLAPALGLLLAAAPDDGHLVDRPKARAWAGATGCSGASSSSQEGSSPSRTARTTRRRRWGSSRSR